MKRLFLISILAYISIATCSAQSDTVIVKDVRSWVLTQDGAYTDSIAVDTAFFRANNYNPVFKKYPNAFYLSNKGSEYQSLSLVDQGITSDFLFITNLDIYFRNPNNIEFFNTKTPYSNFQYYNGPPKRRSEETVSILHTQNITKNWNFGLDYHLSSSIGRYDASQADFRNFRLFTSYQGERYSIHSAIIYNKSFNYQNGGLKSDSAILYNNGNALAENLTVNFNTAQTKIENYRFFAVQSLGIGSLSFMGKDSIQQLPVATAYLTTDINQYRRVYLASDDVNKFYKQLYIDSINTRDSTKFLAVNNVFQLKFNEEANSLLKFGVRAYLGNTIEMIAMPAAPIITTTGLNTKKKYYQHSDTTLISTYIGGQIFKTLGENFWWNGGAKLYFQGYKAGEMIINGNVDSRFRVFKETAGLFANGTLELKAPNYFQDHYYSNHFKWDNNFDKQKNIRLNFGVKVPTRKFQLAGHINYFNDFIYWKEKSAPSQFAGVIQSYGATLHKHSSLWGFNSIDDAVVQYSSNQDVMPLPLFAIYSSNYYEVLAFKVLYIQIGVDIHYNTAYYSPAYNPALGMFTTQKIRKTGDHPFLTPFLNFHLKRANFFLQYENVNLNWPSKDYFLTVGYPYNPPAIKFGLSWNFYD